MTEMNKYIKIALSVTILIALIVIYSFYKISVKVRYAYCGELTARYIMEYHDKFNEWPKCWLDISKISVNNSPFSINEISKSVNVNWGKLGIEIDINTDFYIKSSSVYNGRNPNQWLLEFTQSSNQSLKGRM